MKTMHLQHSSDQPPSAHTYIEGRELSFIAFCSRLEVGWVSSRVWHVCWILLRLAESLSGIQDR